MAIGLYVLCIFALISGYFAVSTMDIQVSMYLQAPARLPLDRPTAARGLVMNAPTGRLFVDATTRFLLGEELIGEAATASHGHLHATLEPDGVSPGPTDLHIEVDHPQIEEFAVDTPVAVVEAPEPMGWPQRTSRRTDDGHQADGEWEGKLRVEVVPTDGEVPRGLPTTLYLRLTDAESGAPVRGTIAIEKVEGMSEGELPSTVRTDRLGLARVPMTPVTSQRWTLSAQARGEDGADLAGTGTVDIHTVASQFSLRMQQSIAVPGQPVDGIVRSLHRSGGMLVDLYDGNHWVYADAFGIAPKEFGVRVIVPDEPREELLRVQVYQDLFGAGKAWDSRWLVRGESASPDACPGALKTVLTALAEHDEPSRRWASNILESGLLDDPTRTARCDRWLEAALLAVPHHFEPSPLLVNTQADDREELDTWRQRVQGRLMVATGGVLFVGFAFVLLLVMQGMQRSRRHADALMEVELETIEDGEELSHQGFDVGKALVVMQVVIIVATLFTFGASILMLLSFM